MLAKKIGYFLISLGLLGVLISLGGYLLGIGTSGLGAMKLLGAQLGLVILLVGAGLIVAEKQGALSLNIFANRIKNLIAGQPLMIWVAAGFVMAYLLFFFIPMFLDYPC